MRVQYTLLDSSSIRQYWNTAWISQPSLFVLLCALNIFIGYGLRSFMVPAPSTVATGDPALPEFSTVEKTFIYRKDLADRPTNDSDNAWAQLFPKQGGYFQHPKYSPERGTFSGFHQLHCLNSIRKGYWKVYDVAQNGKPSDLDALPDMQGPPHVRHCIDLIRQSLMCQPDLTIEVKDDVLGGVHGFGTKHSCLDWDELVAWLTEWEDHGMAK